jgi:hypothetical protein
VDLLSLSQRRKADPTLSSWVPDWRIAQKCNHKAQPENDNSKGPTKLGEYKPRISQMSKCAQCKAETSEILRPCGQLPWNTSFAASGTQSFNLHPSIDKIPSEQLSLYGYTIDTIETVAEPFHPGPKGISKIYDQVLRYFDDIERLCKHSDAKFTSTGDDIYNGAKDVRLSACFLVPTADQEAHGAIFFICRATIPYSRAGYEDILEDISRAARNLDAEKNSPEMQSYRNMLGHQRNRRPFLSETGYVGLAPDAAEVGDQLVIFAGGKFPYVLRKGRDGLCRLVGEAHVHGVMYGEFFTQARVVEEFVLN